MSLDTAKAIATTRGITASFRLRANAATPFYPRVCTSRPSSGADEEYAFLGSMPGMREWLGERKFQELRGGKFTLANKLWEDSILLEKTDIEDDRLGMYSDALNSLADEASYHPDQIRTELLIAGESTATWDNQFFYDTDHSWGDSGSQSNDLTFNAADHTAVTAAEFRSAYHAARTAMLGFKNDRGKKLVRPIAGHLGQLMVEVPPQLELVAHELRAALTGGGNSNVVLDMPEVVVNNELTSGVKFWLHFLGGALKPFVHQPRRGLQTSTKGWDDAETKFVKFMVDRRDNFGYLAWWTSVQTEFN
jgi:phage major head subunit gpT-like protein